MNEKNRIAKTVSELLKTRQEVIHIEAATFNMDDLFETKEHEKDPAPKILRKLYGADVTSADMIAYALVKKAMEGDMKAYEEVCSLCKSLPS